MSENLVVMSASACSSMSGKFKLLELRNLALSIVNGPMGKTDPEWCYAWWGMMRPRARKYGTVRFGDSHGFEEFS